MPRLALALGLAAALSACASDPAPAAGPAADAAPAAAPAGSAAEASTFADACEATAEWDRAMCDCAAGLARSELSEPAHRFVVATLRQDDAATARLRDELSFEEATQAGLFMVRAGRECAGV